VTIILALKGFAQWSTFPLVKRYLHGHDGVSIAEARLGRQEFGGEVHAYAPAWSDDDLREIVTLAITWCSTRRDSGGGSAHRRRRARRRSQAVVWPAGQPRASGGRGRAV
jgi:hypothetical protein